MRTRPTIAAARIFASAASWVLVALATTGCGSSEQSEGANTGGGGDGIGRNPSASLPSGGAATGGSSYALGGASTGGAASMAGANTGGLTNTGGITSSVAAATGGGANTGGANTGGAVNTGGANTGSAVNMGGANTGGAMNTGGTTDTGGSENTGSVTNTGGAATGGSGDCASPAPGTSGQNPLFTDVFTADPAPMVHDCTFYITAGHDEGAGDYFEMFEWFILKSTDMVHWTRSVGIEYTVFDWAYGNAWAGQMVEKDGRFYWYVPVEQAPNGQMAIGVAVADSPEGPFEDAIGAPLVDDGFERQNMGFATDPDTPYTIDPTVFVDDDGQAYLHYGGFSRMVNAKLGSDMISISGTMKESTPECYFEAPYLTKRNGIYYEIYACGANPPTIDYATSNSPTGPWTHKGTLLPRMTTLAGQDAATNHAGVAEFAGQWYIVYHRSDGPNGGGTYHRQVAIDKMSFREDGTIDPVTPSEGLSF